MDYQAFFADVLAWIGEANHAAVRYGMGTSEFWVWAADSSAAVCDKHGNNKLATKVMMTMIEWLEDAAKGAGVA